jgi:uncharacterized protein YdaU (DUF1376 family)
MSKPFPYFRFYPRDYFESTRELTLEQRGAYIDVICLQMMLEGLLKDDDDLLSHHLHISKRKWRVIKASLVEHEKISVEGGMLVNERCARELAALMDERKNRSEAADLREKGKRGDRPTHPRTGAEPMTNSQKKSNEINETGTTAVPQSKKPENSATDDVLNGVQARFDAESALTRGSVNDEPALNVAKNPKKINETGTTTDALRARVSDSDLDKKNIGGEDLAQNRARADADVTPPQELADPSAALRAALVVVKASKANPSQPQFYNPSEGDEIPKQSDLFRANGIGGKASDQDTIALTKIRWKDGVVGSKLTISKSFSDEIQEAFPNYFANNGNISAILIQVASNPKLMYASPSSILNSVLTELRYSDERSVNAIKSRNTNRPSGKKAYFGENRRLAN